jgi:hypothetical protein
MQPFSGENHYSSKTTKMYKSIIPFILCSFVLISCGKDEPISLNNVVGEWQLIEQMIDPGNGTGVFTPVVSNKTIVFTENGTYLSNGSVCYPSIIASEASSGTYSDSGNILNTECAGIAPMPIAFSVEKGELYIFYPCYEGCTEKFERI